jgi:hypothetical protein
MPVLLPHLVLQPGTKLHPMVTLGDILSDLPEVENFCMSDRAFYK